MANDMSGTFMGRQSDTWPPIDSTGTGVRQAEMEPQVTELALAADTAGQENNGVFDNSKMAQAIFKASEEGQVDLSRLMISASTGHLVNLEEGQKCRAKSLDIIDLAVVESILIKNSRNLIQGRYHPRVPAGVFNPLRRHLGIGLPIVSLFSNDTITIQLSYPAAYGTPPVISMAAPFLPATGQGRTSPPPQTGLPMIAGAASVTLAGERRGASGVNLHIAFESDGVVDLGALQLSALSSRDCPTHPWNILPNILVESIELPDGRNLVVGNDPVQRPLRRRAIPGQIFSPGGRYRDWFNFGYLAVSQGQQISFILKPSGTQFQETAGIKCGSCESCESRSFRFSAMFPFWQKTDAPLNRYRPSSFFVDNSSSSDAWLGLS